MPAAKDSEPERDAELHREEARRVGPHGEKCSVAEGDLPCESDNDVEADCEDDKDANCAGKMKRIMGQPEGET